MVRVAQPSGGETTFEKDLPRSPRTIRVSQPSGGKTTFDKELPRSPRTVRVSQPSGGNTTFEEGPYAEVKLRVLKPPGGGSSISFGGEEPHPSKTSSSTATAPHDNKSNGTVPNGNHTNGHPTTNGTCNGTTSNGSVTPNGSCTTASSPSSAKSMDTQSRLFGGADHHHNVRNSDTPVKSTSKPPKVRDHMRSSIFGDDSGTPRNGTTPNGTVHSKKAPKDLPSKGKPEALSSSQKDGPKTEPFPDIKTESKQIEPTVITKSDPAPAKVQEEASKVTDVPKSSVDVPKPEITITKSVESQNNGTPASNPSGGDTTVKASPEPPKPASAPASASAQQKQRVPPGGFSTALW